MCKISMQTTQCRCVIVLYFYRSCRLFSLCRLQQPSEIANSTFGRATSMVASHSGHWPLPSATCFSPVSVIFDNLADCILLSICRWKSLYFFTVFIVCLYLLIIFIVIVFDAVTVQQFDECTSFWNLGIQLYTCTIFLLYTWIILLVGHWYSTVDTWCLVLIASLLFPSVIHISAWPCICEKEK